MRTAKVISLSLPPDMEKEVQKVAKKMKLTEDDVIKVVRQGRQ